MSDRVSRKAGSERSLPLTRSRGGFERGEDYFLPIIQKYVAVEFYKALAYRTLTQSNPQFVFETFSHDWEMNEPIRCPAVLRRMVHSTF